jgi:WD40 repeat protein
MTSRLADGTIRTCDVRSGSEILPPIEGHDMAVMSGGFSPDGAKLVSGCWDKTIRVWDTKIRVESVPLIQCYDDAVLLLEFSADESQLISWSFDVMYRVWEIKPNPQDVPMSPNYKAPIMLLQNNGIASPLLNRYVTQRLGNIISTNPGGRPQVATQKSPPGSNCPISELMDPR